MVGVLSCTVCGGQQVVEEPRALRAAAARFSRRSEEHTSELQSRSDLVCRLLLEKKKKKRLDAGCTEKNSEPDATIVIPAHRHRVAPDETHVHKPRNHRPTTTLIAA